MSAGAAHIAILFEYPTLNGGEHSILSVLQSLREQNHFQFTCIGPPAGPLADRMADLGIPVCGFTPCDGEGRRRDRPALAEQLRRVLAGIAPDILHANSLAMARLVGHSVDILKPCVPRVTGHLRDIIRLNRSTIRDLNALDGLIAVSEATRQFHLRQGLAPHRCRTVHNGITPPAPRPSLEREERQQWFPGISADATIIINVGQICLRKAQLDLAQHVVRLVADGFDLYLLIVGARLSNKPESVRHEAALSDVFREAAMPHRLCLAGQRNDVPQLMRLSDLMVHTARQEPFGRVLLEAAACELPIVCTDVGGTPEMLRAGIDALVCPQEPPAAIETAIVQTIADPGAARARATNARQRVRELFSAERAADAHAAFWRELRTAPAQ